MRIISAAAVTMAVLSLAACKKTGDNEYELQKPVLSTVPETVSTPSVKMESSTVVVPKLKVEKETVTVKKPVVKNP